MNRTIGMIIGIFLLVGCCGILLYHMENYEEEYYSIIDNQKMKELSTDDDMKYEYTLECYNAKGKRKVLKFKTRRILKEDAYILLEVRALGVYQWREVKFDELPKKVQNKL